MQTNYDLIEANKIASERALERANFYDRYFTVNRSLSGADELWTQYLENNPILIRNDKGEIVKNPSRFKSYVDYFRSVEGRSQGGQRSPSRATGPTSPTFANEKDAQAAFDRGDIQQGDEIIVNGVRGNWE
jgi:hypothetical protein